VAWTASSDGGAIAPHRPDVGPATEEHAMQTTTTIRLRPLRRGETDVVDAVFAGMSDESRHLRFHGPRPRLTDAMRRALADADGSRHVALVAEVVEGDDVAPVGLAHLIALDGETAEIAFSVVDAWHGRGIGRRLVTALRHRAVDLGYHRLLAHVMVGNKAAQALLWSVLPDGVARRVGMAHEFTAQLPPRPSTVPVTLAV
jgi:RimJ/RimL family protein N-acetyltransferase